MLPIPRFAHRADASRASRARGARASTGRCGATGRLKTEQDQMRGGYLSAERTTMVTMERRDVREWTWDRAVLALRLHPGLRRQIKISSRRRHARFLIIWNARVSTLFRTAPTDSLHHRFRSVIPGEIHQPARQADAISSRLFSSYSTTTGAGNRLLKSEINRYR